MKLGDSKKSLILVHDPNVVKSVPIPEGFILIQDTREQLPLFGSESWIVNAALKNGDYSIKGFEDAFCVERKQISDFMSYIGKERNKTTVKMERFAEMKWVGLAIEATENELFAGIYQSSMTTEQVRAALVSFEVRYNVHIYYDRDRRNLARWVLDRAVKFYKIQREVK